MSSMLTQLHGDCVDLLPGLSLKSVQTVVTSPPYYGLRDYGLPPTLWPTISYRPMPGLPPITLPGCAPDCDHEWGEPIIRRGPAGAQGATSQRQGRANVDEQAQRGQHQGETCQRCGGWRGCLGLEPDPIMYIGHLVLIFRLLSDVLADDGTAWLNLGDSYAASSTYNTPRSMHVAAGWKEAGRRPNVRASQIGLKDKDLLGIPWRAAFALQADGWYLRAENIWNKPNCMPESVDDRPTRAHEYVFLLAKSKRYYYDVDATREPYAEAGLTRYEYQFKSYGADHPQGTKHGAIRDGGEISANPKGRNRRTVWSISTKSYTGAHYAVMPEALADICIKAGSRPGDAVLDPFGGSGTVGRRAIALGRRAILMDLNADYLALQDERTAAIQMELDAA